MLAMNNLRKKWRHKKLLKKFEEGKPIPNEGLLELALGSYERRDLYERVLLALTDRVEKHPAVVGQLLQLVRKECRREQDLMSDIARQYPEHSLSHEMVSPVDRAPFELLSELGQRDLLPVLRSMLDALTDSVEYKVWWDAEHDMTVSYVSETRKLLSDTMRRISERFPQVT
jgi:hypothetical protein